MAPTAIPATAPVDKAAASESRAADPTKDPLLGLGVADRVKLGVAVEVRLALAPTLAVVEGVDEGLGAADGEASTTEHIGPGVLSFNTRPGVIALPAQ
jgi:hypothetical protein